MQQTSDGDWTGTAGRCASHDGFSPAQPVDARRMTGSEWGYHSRVDRCHPNRCRSENGRKHAAEVFLQSVPDWSLKPGHRVDLFRMSQICVKLMFQLFGNAVIVKDGTDFKVKKQAACVEIWRPNQ